MKGLDDMEIRSEEVSDILSYIPSWMIRFGNSLIFILLFVIISFTWLIKYPEILVGEITLTTENPPIKIVTKTTGRINTLFCNDAKTIKKGDFIAEIENPIDKKSVDYLNYKANLVEHFLLSPNTKLDFEDTGLVFGDIQNEYNILKKKCIDYQNHLTDSYAKQKISNLERQITYHKKLVSISLDEITLASKELENTQAKYEVYKKLFEGKSIAKLEFLDRENEYSQKQQTFNNLKKTILNYQISITDYEKQLLTLKDEDIRAKRDFNNNIKSSLSVIQNFIHNWQQGYILSAPISGKLTYLKSISEKQYVTSNEMLFAVVPQEQQLIGKIKIPSRGYGKIKLNQKVRIKLNDYPFQEYGFLTGRISSVSIIGNENNYRCDIVLDKGLVTTYKKRLDFKSEMGGTAEVVTDDLRLIQRILYRFKSIFS